MKRVFTIGGFALALAGAVLGQGRGGGPGGGPRFNPIIGALDADHDGTISASEMKNAPQALAKLDKNGDGQLTEDELRPAFEGRGPGGPAGGAAPDDLVKTLMAFDANGDGKLSKDEVPERMQGVFARGDSNQDGFLTRDEIQKLAAAQTQGNRGGGREGRGGEDRAGGPPRDRVTSALDSDRDGVISAAEIKNAAKALKSLDANGDGQLTEDELRPQGGPGGFGGPGGGRGNPSEMASRMIEEGDRNGDGKLSKGEMPERMRAMFEQGDTNKDGFISKDELIKLIGERRPE